jgi:hypothetical protein
VEVGDVVDIDLFKAAVSSLTNNRLRWGAQKDIPLIVYRALGVAEMRAPIAVRGAFIPAGNAFDAFAAVGKILAVAARDIMIVDPYMDEKALTDFAPLAGEGIGICLLADETHRRPTLIPARQRWATQYGLSRPLDVRLAPKGALHDRLIIVDHAQAWILTQSLNAFAARSPASIVRVDQEAATLKIAAYTAIWNSAVVA